MTLQAIASPFDVVTVKPVSASPVHGRDLPAQMEGRVEGGGLFLEIRDQIARIDARKTRNIVDRLFRIKRGALPADFIQRVDHMGLDAQHAELENGEQADGAGADNNGIGLETGGGGGAFSHDETGVVPCAR